jgi:hypothetical protein
MKLLLISQDAIEVDGGSTWRNYQPGDKHLTFAPDQVERDKLFTGGALLVLRIPADGGLPDLQIAKEPRDHVIVEKR